MGLFEMRNDAKIQKLNRLLEEAQEKLREQDAIIKALQQTGAVVCRVIHRLPGSALISGGEGMLVSSVPQNLESQAKVGALVQVNEAGAIAKIIDHTIPSGELTTIIREVGNRFEVMVRGEPQLVMSAVKKAEPGDQVLVQDNIITENLGRQTKHSRAQKTGVSWANIGGLKEEIDRIREAIELPRTNPEIFKRYGRKPAKGLLLSGPPGCGKTLIGKAIATSLAEEGAEAFMYVKGPELLNMYVGNTEASIRQLFESAREHKRDTSNTAVIFIDESDAILGHRGSRRTSGMEQTVVPMFLAEMDGLDESAAVVVLATNRPEMLDEAVIRDGRIDEHIDIPRPDEEQLADIATIHLEGKPLGEAKNVMAHHVSHSVFESTVLSEIASGALAASLIDKATSFAIRRELKSKKKSKVTKEDLTGAITVAESDRVKATQSGLACHC